MLLHRTYFLPKFSKKLDVLDLDKTTFVRNTNLIIKPSFDSEKIKDFSIFPLLGDYDEWKITSSNFVSESLKKLIQKELIIGGRL